VDADNCCDRIAHPIALQVFQALGVPKEAAASMCSTIQNMQFYLRTGFGDSSESAGAVGNIKTQGMCQGNGAASAAWTVMSITIINAHEKKGHGVRVTTPISKLDLHLAGSLFVDDTDLMHLDTHKSKTALEAMEALQDAVTNWRRLLIATGGALKPAKCFYHLISFLWKPDGTWHYNDNHKNPAFQLHVPLANGDMAPIKHLSVDSPSKTLGL
jgi:hypothetical protein